MSDRGADKGTEQTQESTEAVVEAGTLEAVADDAVDILERSDLRDQEVAKQPETVERTAPNPATVPLRLRFVEDVTGQPIPGLKIEGRSSLRSDFEDAVFFQEVTDHEGWLEGEILVGEVFYYWALRDSEGQPLSWHVRGEVGLTAGEVLEKTITMPQLFVMHVQIVNPQGQGLPGAQLQYWCNTRIGREHAPYGINVLRQADENGFLDVPFFEGRLTMAAEVESDAFLKTGWRRQVGEAQHGTHLVLEMIPAQTVDVLVLDDHERPVEGAQLSVAYAGFSGKQPILHPYDTLSVETNADGHGVLRVDAGSGAALTVSHPEYHAAELDVPPDAEQLIVHLSMGPSLHGVVQDDQGAPIQGAKVYGWCAGMGFMGRPSRISEWKSTETDADGRFAIPSLIAGKRTQCMVIASGFAYGEAQWTALPEHEVVLSLEPEAPLFGFYLDAEGVGIHNILVEIRGTPAFSHSENWGTISYYAETYRIRTGEDG
ncbi:MAG: carboxypeptidase-like regulatory domain-containing protein, partial [Planctomycetota bacterium]